jgi:putative DNA primase/helicase
LGYLRGEIFVDEEGQSEYQVTEYILLPEVFKREVCGGFDVDLVVRELLSRDILLRDAQGKSTRQTRLPDSLLKRCYVLSHKKLYESRE